MDVQNGFSTSKHQATTFSNPIPGLRCCSQKGCGRLLELRSAQNRFCDFCLAAMRPYSNRGADNGSNGDISRIDFFAPPEGNPKVFRAPEPIDTRSGLQLVPVPPGIRRKPPLPTRQGLGADPKPLPRVNLEDPSRFLHVPDVSSVPTRLNHFNSRGEFIIDVEDGVPDTASPLVFASRRGVAPLAFNDVDDQGITRIARPSIQVKRPFCDRCRSYVLGHWSGKICPRCRVDAAFEADLAVASRRAPTASVLPTRLGRPPREDRKKLTDSTRGEPPGKDVGAGQGKGDHIPKIRLKLKVQQPHPVEASGTSVHPSSTIHQKGPQENETPISTLSSEKLFDNVKISKSTLLTLKLCSTPNCTGSIASDSTATRCLGCVRLDWESKKKGQFKSSPLKAKNEPAVPSNEPSEPPRKRPRKSVTWADTLTEALEDGEVIQRSALNADASTLLSVVDQREDALEYNRENRNLSVQALEPSSSTDLFQDSSSTVSAQPETPAPAECAKRISGWDSDLSDLTDSSDGESEADASSDEEKSTSTPTLTGLKIRLPARPAGIYSRKCGNPRCSQLLSTTYRWKSCIICPARSRQYQRKRYNVQNGHIQLDTEVTELAVSQNMCAVVPKDSKVSQIDTMVLVPNARLCSARECSHIIPSADEFRMKTCSLCRLRRREWSELQKQDSASGDVTQRVGLPKYVVDPIKLFESFRYLPVRPPTPGRCQSIDCGVLLESGSLCRQCKTRRSMLMNKPGTFEVSPSAATKQQAPPPPELRSYPQYKNFAVLLSDFKDRISGFLKAQSLFFLFKTADPKFSHNALFVFDGEFSMVALDFNIVEERAKVDANAVRLKRDIERVGKIRFSPKRLVSILEGGGMAIRFVCSYEAPVLQPIEQGTDVSVTTLMKTMQGELEIAVLPDNSHRFLPGRKTIVRFRLLG